MWKPENYTPIATFFKDVLTVQESELTKGGVVYVLDFGENNLYVGSTLNLKNRLRQHVEYLQQKKHTQTIHFAYNVGGVFNAYILLSLPSATEDDLREAENSMIHLLCPRLNVKIPTNSSLKANRAWLKVELVERNKEYDGSYKNFYQTVISDPNNNCPHCGKPIVIKTTIE